MAEVLVFTMIGCPACYQLKPVAQRVGAHYASCVETKFIDVDRERDPPHDIAHAQAEGLARYLVNDAMNSILDGEAPDAGRDEKIAPSELN